MREILAGSIFRGVLMYARSMGFFLVGVMRDDVTKTIIMRAEQLHSRIRSGDAANHGKERNDGKNAFHSRLLRFRNE